MARPICVLVCALGGEGGGVLAEWLYGAAVRAGHAAQATSIPGVAQRTGATTYYLELSAAPWPADRPPPVFSLSPVPGGVDLLVSSELLETLRQAANGFVGRARTRVVTSTARALTVAEKMAQADGRTDRTRLVTALRKAALGVDLLDVNALAREAGTAVSAVLLGAMAASGVLPMPRSAYEDAIRAAGKGVKASLAGFALAFDVLQAQRRQEDQARAWIDSVAPPPRLEGAALRRLARERVAGFQDEAYARLFDARLARLDAAAAGAAGAALAGPGTGTAVGDEAARWLALWMCFDDIVQVAALKLAAGRQARVRREVAAGADDIVKVYDHFKPGVPELAGLLPGKLAARLIAWDRRRVAAGREPWALPLRLGTHGLRGALALRFAARLKGWRRRGARFADEQALIERWLAAVESATREDATLGLELARCGALVKGYGSTNERGKENLLHIIDHLAAHGAQAVRDARAAALADDAGHALDLTLAAHGAPQRPPREQVVRWFKRRPAAQGS